MVREPASQPADSSTENRIEKQPGGFGRGSRGEVEEEEEERQARRVCIKNCQAHCQLQYPTAGAHHITQTHTNTYLPPPAAPLLLPPALQRKCFHNSTTANSYPTY